MAAMMPVPDCNNHVVEGQDYQQKYKSLKRKLKFLLYEQEYFQENLRRSQKKLLRVSRDKSFLLDRLLQYEQVGSSSSDEDDTASSSEASDEGSKIALGDTSTHNNKLKKSHSAQNIAAESGFNTTLSSAPKTKDKTSSGGQSSKLVPCKFTSNGRQCQEMVSKRSKSGYCNAHRTVVRITKQGISGGSKSSKTLAAKDDKAEQLESLHRLSESSTSSQVPQATEQLPHNVFNMEDDDQESENEDSPGSASYQYEGDDDLVIDLPE